MGVYMRASIQAAGVSTTSGGQRLGLAPVGGHHPVTLAVAVVGQRRDVVLA